MSSGSKLKGTARSSETDAVSTTWALFKIRLCVTQQYIDRQWKKRCCLNLRRVTVCTTEMTAELCYVALGRFQARGNVCSPQHQTTLTVPWSPAGPRRGKAECLQIFWDAGKVRLFLQVSLGKRAVYAPRDLLQSQCNQNTLSHTLNIQITW